MSQLPTTLTEPLDPLTGFRVREQFIADLTAALEPGSPPRTLAVFDLVGLSEHRRSFGERASDELIARLAEAFARVVVPAGSCYRPRRDEFCSLVAGRIDEADGANLLPEAARALLEAGEGSLTSSWFGACLLPEEAADPIEALMLADERLLVRSDHRASRERRHGERRGDSGSQHAPDR